MKYAEKQNKYLKISSHPARGAWIEIFTINLEYGMVSRRTPQGVRGLKSIEHVCIVSRLCRTPQGVRGLKSIKM